MADGSASPPQAAQPAWITPRAPNGLARAAAAVAGAAPLNPFAWPGGSAAAGAFSLLGAAAVAAGAGFWGTWAASSSRGSVSSRGGAASGDGGVWARAAGALVSTAATRNA